MTDTPLPGLEPPARPRTRSETHTCHALNCDRNVPPRMHMCKTHWWMVPKRMRDNLWANYRRGQERSMTPSAAYLRAAADCVRAVAEHEHQPVDQIEAEVNLYLTWAEMIEAD